MAPTLRHAVVFSVLFVLGHAMGVAAGRVVLVPLGVLPLGGVFVVAFAGGCLGVLLFAWPVMRRLHCRPLMLPKCPYCRRLPRSYQASGREWPRVVLVCADCGRPTEIWMARAVDAARRARGMPSLRLRWPEFIGRWTPS